MANVTPRLEKGFAKAKPIKAAFVAGTAFAEIVATCDWPVLVWVATTRLKCASVRFSVNS